ncbi:MAG: anti-sigma factor antagonist [Candidatus Omnitrophota bacterium]|jgi:anti-sigma B factor antagonist|nr:MAG: anti-sigma factor antagonist [Candidatus Omnitrophota bacterium]
MNINRIDLEHVTTLSFDEEEQLRDAEALRDYLNAIINEGRLHILLDLKNATYISSSVLGCFITTFRQLVQKGGKLKLASIRPNVANIFEMTRLDRIIEILSDRKTAYKSFGLQKSIDDDIDVEEFFL